MLGLAISLSAADGSVRYDDSPLTSPQIEITAEPGIELDAGDGAMLTES